MAHLEGTLRSLTKGLALTHPVLLISVEGVFFQTSIDIRARHFVTQLHGHTSESEGMKVQQMQRAITDCDKHKTPCAFAVMDTAARLLSVASSHTMDSQDMSLIPFMPAYPEKAVVCPHGMVRMNATNEYHEFIDGHGKPCSWVLGVTGLPPSHPQLMTLQKRVERSNASVYYLTNGKNRRKFKSTLQDGWNTRWHSRTQRAAKFQSIMSPYPFLQCHPGERNVVMTVGNYADPRIFYRMLRSLREAGAHCDAVIFTNSTSSELDAISRRYEAVVVNYLDMANALGMSAVAMNSLMSSPSRQILIFSVYKLFLERYGQKYNRVALFDVRDVIFQRDPFSAALCSGLTAFTETASIELKDKPHVYFSSHWPKERPYSCYNNLQDENLDQYPPINSGVLIADVKSMLLFIGLFLCEIKQCGGWDQAVITRLIYADLRKLVKVNVLNTELSRVAHLCFSLSVAVHSLTGDIMNEAGEPYAVVHMYDRFDLLLEAYKLRFPYTPRSVLPQWGYV